MPPALASFRRPRLDRTTAHVCVCAFLLQCKPSEPHLVPYLKDVKGFSSAQVEADILPVSVYASLVFFLLAGPAASGTSTKAVLVAGGACKLLTRVLLLWGRTLGAMRLMEVAFAAGAASDLMLYAYLAETAPSADADRTDGVRDAPASISGGGAEGASPASFGSDAPPAGSQVRFATGAASASAMLGYMLAAELGQIAFERGASYDSLFVVSLITVALGCVGLATLPGDGKATSPNASPKTTTRPNAAVAVVRATSRERDAGGGPAASATTSKKRPRNDASVREKAIRAVVAASESCYGSSAAIALSAWWVLGTPPASALENYALSVLNDAEEDAGGRDAGGHVVFFARAASAVAALAAARAHPKVAAAPETYAAASAATAACAAVFSTSTSVVAASVAYALAVACVHGVSVLVFAQTSLCAAAARSAMRCHGAGYAEMEDAAEEGDVLSRPFARAPPSRDPGISPPRTGERRDDGGGDEGLLFGLNGAFALVVLVITQASVDASRGGARGAAAAAAVLAALAAGAVVAIAAARRVALGAEWALAPAPSDVSYAWLARLLLAE